MHISVSRAKWRVFKWEGLVMGGLVLLLTGCASSNREAAPQEWSLANSHGSPAPPLASAPVSQVTPSPPPSSLLEAVAAQPVAATPVATPAASVPMPVPVEPIQASASPSANAAGALTWTSLERWAAAHDLAAPRKLGNSPLITYAVTSPQGTLALAIGSRAATWRGTDLHLGFPPELVDGQVFVHKLDLQKNLEPLLLGGPLTLGASRVIVLDPGHGGTQPGAVSVADGRTEKDFTLDWARRIQSLLAAKGWTVWLTRTNDAEVSLADRVAFAEACHADIFVSLHFNSVTPDHRQKGLEIYCLTPTGMPSTLIRGFSDPLDGHYPNNDFDAANLQLAVRLQDALLHATGEDDRGVRRARFMGVLLGQRRPAVLIEGGYLSNPQEASRIASAEFRQKLAEAVAEALN